MHYQEMSSLAAPSDHVSFEKPAPSLGSVKEKKEERSTEQTEEETAPFTVFSSSERYVLVFLAASVCAWSTIGAPIYYPALGTLEKEFNISQEMVNVSVVVYLLCQGVVPTLLSSIADIYGRRPVIIVCLCFFIGASTGIAVINNYNALLILRCIQSAGISPTVPVGSGMLGDFTQRHERGAFVGFQSGFSIISQAFGPLIGAALVTGFDWRAIFWFLVIGGGVSLIMVVLLLPETKRSIVGNGSIKPKRWINIAPVLLLSRYQKQWKLDTPNTETLDLETSHDYLAIFKILKLPEVTICLMNGAIHYAVWVVALTCLTTELDDIYHYSVMKIGLCYIAAGVGGLIGSILSGRIMDYVYRRLHSHYQKQIETGVIPQDTPFNIIRARVIVVFPFVLLGDGFTIMFGWCIYKHVHIAAVCVSAFFLSFGFLSVVSINMVMMIDLYPSNSSVATSCVNLTRCLMAALFVGTLTYMNRAMTVGGTLTMLAAVGVVFAISLIIPVRYAQEWRAARLAKRNSEDLK